MDREQSIVAFEQAMQEVDPEKDWEWINFRVYEYSAEVQLDGYYTVQDLKDFIAAMEKVEAIRH